jgi:arylsulfatase A-like enzyme
MIVRIPGLTEGNATVRGDVGLVDVAPTILETLKLPVPDGMYGRSFLPEISGQRSGVPRGTASGFMTSFRTLASGRYKLVQRGADKGTLYDLRADPGETRDVAAAKPIALRHTRGLLGLTLAGSGTEAATERKVHKQEKTKIDAATEAQLRALGYVGTSRR